MKESALSLCSVFTFKFNEIIILESMKKNLIYNEKKKIQRISLFVSLIKM